MNRDKEIVKTSVMGIAGNLLLVVGKMIVGVLASSISIVTDAVNNLTDAMSSTVTVAGTRLAARRPTKKHPFGYGRVEFITTSVIAMLIFLAGALAIYESVTDLVEGSAPTYDAYSFVIISLAIVVKIALGLFFRYKGKKVASDALNASGLDALLDCVLSLGTLVGAIVSYTTGVHLEGYIGIAIGLFIIKTAVDVLRDSASKIIGERTDAHFVGDMTADIAAHPLVMGVYDLILNNYGPDNHIGSVHVQVDDALTAKQIQFLERDIAFMCYQKYHTIMTVGVYADNQQTELEREIKANIQAAVAHHKEILQMHGFFVDVDKKIISADIIISFDCDDTEQLYNHVREDIAALYPDYTVQLVLDRDFSVS